MTIQAVLGNPRHPEYGVATIPFPIPHDQYAHCMELLEALEIGDAVKADCQVQEINSFYSVLKRTEMLTVNAEELNYLAKRLDTLKLYMPLTADFYERSEYGDLEPESTELDGRALRGYYYAATAEELERCIRQLRSRIKKIAFAERGLSSALPDYVDTGQLSLPLDGGDIP